MSFRPVKHTVCVNKTGVAASQFVRALIHVVYKCADTAVNIRGKDIARIIRRMYKGALDQIFIRHDLARLNSRIGGTDIKPLQAVCLCGNHVV